MCDIWIYLQRTPFEYPGSVGGQIRVGEVLSLLTS